MALTTVLWRTLLMYFFVLFILRLMGKREIGQLSVFDFVISIMIAEIAVFAIEGADQPIWISVAPIALLVLTQMALAFLSLKNRRIRLLFDGKPSVFIQDGKLNWREMRKQRYTLDDLAMQLREHNVTDVEKVRLAVLEPSGKLSVIPMEPSAAAAPRPAAERGGAGGATEKGGAGGAEEKAQPKVRFEVLPLPLIMDGQVQEENLAKIGKTRLWLKRELKQYGIDRFKDVFYCSIDHRGKLFVDRKD